MNHLSRTQNASRGLRQSGQALLEMALVTPLLLALALGVIELGRYAYVAILVGNAAHAGAAYGAQSLVDSVDTAGITQAACNDFQGNGFPQAACESGLPNSGQDNILNVSSSATCGCDNGGSTPVQTNCSGSAIGSSISSCSTGGGHWVVMVSVETSGTFQSLFKYPGIPRSITVDRTATMRVAQQ